MRLGFLANATAEAKNHFHVGNTSTGNRSRLSNTSDCFILINRYCRVTVVHIKVTFTNGTGVQYKNK